MEEYIEILKKCPLFNGIDKEQIINTLKCISNNKVVSFKKGEFIAKYGDEYIGFGIVLSGEIIVCKEDNFGERNIITSIKEGELFGEMLAFSEAKKWIFSIEANKDAKIIYIFYNKIISDCDSVCFGHKMLINNLFKIISNKALKLSKKIEYISLKSIKSKLCTYLYDEYVNNGNTFNISMNRNELAEYLNVSRPSLSREMANLKAEGVIDYHLESIKIVSVELLCKFIYQK